MLSWFKDNVEVRPFRKALGPIQDFYEESVWLGSTHFSSLLNKPDFLSKLAAGLIIDIQCLAPESTSAIKLILPIGEGNSLVRLCWCAGSSEPSLLAAGIRS